MIKKEKMNNFSIKGNLIGYLILFFSVIFVISSCRVPPPQKKLSCELGTSSTTGVETGIKVITIAGCGSSEDATAGWERQINYSDGFVKKGANEFLLASVGQKKQKITIDANGKAIFADFSLPDFPADGFSFKGADSNYIYVVEYSPRGRIFYSVDSTTLASTKLAGGNEGGSFYGPVGDMVQLSNPRVATPAPDALYFIDNYYVKKIELSGTYDVSYIAGGPYTTHETVDGSGTAVSFRELSDMLYIESSNKLIVLDSGKYIIREVDLNNKNYVKTIAGVASFPFTSGRDDNANPLLATFDWPRSIALSPSGNIYVADSYLIRKIAVNNGVYGAVTTVVGSARYVDIIKDTKANENGRHNARDAILYSTGDLVFDGNSLYFIDGNFLGSFIRKVEFLDATP